MTVQHLSGSCQCGAVKYEMDVDLDNTLTCNCSRCQRLGSVLAFTPATHFKLLQGGNNLTEYLFNKMKIRHTFCKTCGIEGFAHVEGKDGTPMVAVNANCLDGIDSRALKSTHWDGKSI